MWNNFTIKSGVLKYDFIEWACASLSLSRKSGSVIWNVVLGECVKRNNSMGKKECMHLISFVGEFTLV